jgi:Tol biopolymer transport system component
VTFDARSLKVTGDPATIAEHIAEVGDNHEFDFSVSDDGVLAYQSGSPTSQLTWFDRTGKKLNSLGEPTNYWTVALSPDERRAAVSLLDADGRIADVWLLDLTRGSISRLTFDPSSEGNPVWSPDGNNIVYGSTRRGDGHVQLYEKAASGAGDDQLLLQSASDKYATSWSRDGQFILFDNWPVRAKAGIWLLPLNGERQPKPLLQTAAFDQTGGQFSPDARFVAYMSNESGRTEVYVRPFPLSDDKWQISSGGGQFPLWRADGKELFFVTDEGRLMSAEIRASEKFESSVPEQLFRTNIKNPHAGLCYAAAVDGQRFLVNTFVEGDNPAPMIVVLNWTADLKH